MTRFPQAVYDVHRPARGVRITKIPTTAGDRYIAACACGWQLTSPIRAVVDEEARWHRGRHRTGATP